MADRLVTIRKLLTHERQDRRCAAAIVMAELGVKDRRSINALSRATKDEDPLVRRYIVEALGQTADESVVEELIGTLNDPDLQVQQASESALLQMGDAAVTPLRQMMEGPAGVRRKAAAVLSRLQSTAGVDSLVDTIDGNDASVLDRTRQALRGRAVEMSAAELRTLRKRLEQRLSEARFNGDANLAAALLALLGDLPDETMVTRLVMEVGPEVPPLVRRAALAAMMTALPAARGRRREAAIEKLLGCLSEDDEEGVIRPTLRALGDIDVPERLGPKLEELVDAPSAAARAWALAKLGRFGSPETITTLIEQLVQGAAPVRAAAREALGSANDAAVPLAKALLEVSDPVRLEDVGDLLRQHRDQLPPEEAAAVCATVADRIEAGELGLGTLISTLGRALPEQFMTELLRRATAHRQGGRLAEAYNLLDAVKSCPAFGEDERYQLALLGLLSATPAKGRPPRATDKICMPFAELLRTGYPLESKLRREESVEPHDLFYIGFAFAESHDEEERDFGHEILEEVAARDASGKYGARAQNKLKLIRR